MDKSIETIWKEGFLKSDALVAPKLNDLYNRKSIHFVEKFKRMLRFNHYFIIFLPVVCAIVGYFLAGIYLSLFMILLFIPIIIVSDSNLKKMGSIDNGASSYQYVTSFDNWLKSAIANYTKIFRYFNAFFFTGMIWGLWLSKSEEILRKFPEAYLIGGVPAILMVGFAIALGLIVVFGEAIYKFDLRLMYGCMFKKLESLIADMEELRTESIKPT